MAILFGLGLLLFGIWVIASIIVTLIVMVSPIAIVVLLGYWIWRFISVLRAIEKARATARASSKGEK